MDPQTVFLLAAVIVQGISFLVVAALWQPLHAVLHHPGDVASRARFWRCYVCLMLVVVPMAGLLLARHEVRENGPWLLVTADLLRWPITCLAVALLILGLLMAALTAGRTVSVSISRDQADDLGRLLSKVDEIRARHILERVEPKEESAKPQAKSGSSSLRIAISPPSPESPHVDPTRAASQQIQAHA